MMNERCVGKGPGFAQGMRRGAGRGDRFFLMAESLIGKALIPEDEAQQRVVSQAGVVAVTGGFGAVSLRNVRREAFLEMLARCREVTQGKARNAHHEAETRENMRGSEA